jgi:glucosamine-6-phosphate deaminase
MSDARVEVFPAPAGVAARAASIIAETATSVPRANLALPTGSTPLLTYGELRRRVAASEASFAAATVWAIDEFAGVAPETPGTNSAFYRKYVHLGQRALHCPNPTAAHPDEHIAAFAAAMRKAHGLDLCVLGVGANGHIAFNEPGSGRDSRARVVALTEGSRQAHAEDFGSLEAVPARGMTLGVADLLESRAVVVLATGVAKAAIVARAIEGPQTAEVPASWLQSVDALWLLDEAAASGLRRRR